LPAVAQLPPVQLPPVQLPPAPLLPGPLSAEPLPAEPLSVGRLPAGGLLTKQSVPVLERRRPVRAARPALECVQAAEVRRRWGADRDRWTKAGLSRSWR
jgi:hypothetical protein